MDKVSVIIPVYNTELFVAQCIQSVIDQTYQNYEIIVIDDGSVDQSRKICEKFALADQRTRFYSQNHKGVSSARNYGLDHAEGDYVFFLDSDDAIHPFLLEKLMEKAESCHAELAFCTCKRQNAEQMDKTAEQSFESDVKVQWEIGEKTDSEEWFHGRYARELTCIGGKLIRRNAIGALRFDESMHTGEDTVFMYHLACKSIRMIYYKAEWYYYRMHPQSITHSDEARFSAKYFKKYEVIRDSEIQRNHQDTAFEWERHYFGEMQRRFLIMKSAGDKEGMRGLKKLALKEMRHPMFRKFRFTLQIFWMGFFICNRVYSVLSRWLWIIRRRKMMKREVIDAGILTFHCADDYGAMLQAYALKQYLNAHGVRTDLVRYEPAFMRGRYWWIPYIPAKGLKKKFWLCWGGWKKHCSMGKNFFILQKYMKKFRREHLVKAEQKKLICLKQFRDLPYRCYIVGSDQIWNPEITYGLRKGYFGAFDSRCKEKVIAYAASLGGEKIPSDYTREFSRLLKSLDAVSMREEEAVHCVKQCYRGNVTAVCDPVFLLKKEEWIKIEKTPDREHYIFVYATQMNPELSEYVIKLSREKRLPVVELRTSTNGSGEDFQVDYAAGPAEFLGYIHKADYVVTNSFHAAAFSIIYQKKFLVFLHRSRGARLRNILSLHGLEGRLYQENADIDADIAWNEVKLRATECAEYSGDFLKKSLA